MDILEKLIRDFARLPGLGRKSAARIVYTLLKSDRAYVDGLARDILEMKSRVQLCGTCGNYTVAQPCPICADPSRDRSILCVVEEPKDVQSIETIHEYRGLYHVLMGVISPINGVGPGDLRIRQLLERIRDQGVSEVILATNPTVEGDTTALYIVELLRDRPQLVVSRLALGLPVGGDLEYADRLTLARAFSGRGKM